RPLHRADGVLQVIVNRLLDARRRAGLVRIEVGLVEELIDAAMGDQFDFTRGLGREPACVEQGEGQQDEGGRRAEAQPPAPHPSSSRARAQSCAICWVSASTLSNFASGRRKWWRATSTWRP